MASVSCIYGLGSPEAYLGMLLHLELGMQIPREDVLKKLVEIHYERGDYDFYRGRFRVRGDIVDIFPVHEESRAFRIGFFGDEIEEIREIDPLTGRPGREMKRITVYPATHYVTTVDIRERAIRGSGRSSRSVKPSSAACKSSWRPADRGADPVRSGDDDRDGVLPRHRELLQAPDRTRSG